MEVQRQGRPSFFRRLAIGWGTLTSAGRRRIVLGSLFAASLAAWDLVLLVVVGSLFALSEAIPAGRSAPRRASS